MHFTKRFFLSTMVMPVFAIAPCAHALPPAAGTMAAAFLDGTPSAEQALPPDTGSSFVQGFGVAAGAQQLDSARGGSGGVASATVRGIVTGNSATNVVSGANTIQASSFAGAVGIPIVIQNSGANVLIQNATVINLQLQ